MKFECNLLHNSDGSYSVFVSLVDHNDFPLEPFESRSFPKGLSDFMEFRNSTSTRFNLPDIDTAKATLINFVSYFCHQAIQGLKQDPK